MTLQEVLNRHVRPLRLAAVLALLPLLWSACRDNGSLNKQEEGPCTLGASRGCFVGTAQLKGVGECHEGSQTCEVAELGVWSTCTGSGSPTAEVCDGKDNDCDG